MISMLQQFYNIPAFRYLMLQTPDTQPDDIQEYKGHQINDKLIYQFQKMLAHLELSDRSAYNPFEFCFAFKEMDGSPTKVGEQQDTEEFFNKFMERIETVIKPSPERHLLSSIFGGKNCSQMVC